jgi:hypothetical protein
VPLEVTRSGSASSEIAPHVATKYPGARTATQERNGGELKRRVLLQEVEVLASPRSFSLTENEGQAYSCRAYIRILL